MASLSFIYSPWKTMDRGKGLGKAFRKLLPAPNPPVFCPDFKMISFTH
jgi:hypothetical protein